MDDDDDSYEDLLALDQGERKRLRAKLIVNNEPMIFTLDTGSSVNLITLSLARKLEIDRKMKRPERVLRMFSDQVLQVEGMVECRLEAPTTHKVCVAEFYVV
jgi:hypothetical protein